MDDLEFRRRIMSDPKQKDQDVLLAAAESDANSKFLEDVLKLDAQIEAAMKVDVPEDLADKILFNQSAQEQKNVVPFAQKATKRMMALAASIAFAAGIMVGQINWAPVLVSPAHASIAQTALNHVSNEKAFIAPLDEAVEMTQINKKMMPFSYQFTDVFPYHVYYLNHCGFGSSNAMHMVFEGEKGRVTLFLTTEGNDGTQYFDKDGMSGSITEMGSTNMIIVGNEGEDVAKIAEKLKPIIKPMS
ncbi:DUF3379 family protein [Vibrio sp. SCSIO 43136]|uniref:DUF3379 family protein n=1 Tax=Vibrio sp. SCSIO 43136 TaxID=2819101 RepID=UPI0020754116|nr:DUF3379 family protein [Vibrio sp. SCSIO 43136]USD66011.1 DUF3379 domain-containing protein [Vibrio sp. SCSIO 43136]